MDTLVLDRLNKLSVERHADAYADIAWESEELRIDPADPRFALWSVDPLTETQWYKAQPIEVQTRLGLWRVATAMRVGWEFENILQRGALAYLFRLDNGAPQFRYLHHEIIEESQHTLMFQEFVNRTGLPVKGLPWRIKRAAERIVIPLSGRFPALFFLFVLGGEEPVDHLQRRLLRDGGLHPLVERIIRIHVAEEARHVSFARHYLATEVPKLGWARKQVMGAAAPVLMGIMSRLMLEPSRYMLRKNGVPRAVAREAYGSPEAHELLRDSVAKVRNLWDELGLVNAANRPLWKLLRVG
ncbi:MAG: diiron oxygenase [Actinomycetota bacterium]|nr:diiron oxygenase [Actinomycetota bacterium]